MNPTANIVPNSKEMIISPSLWAEGKDGLTIQGSTGSWH